MLNNISHFLQENQISAVKMIDATNKKILEKTVIQHSLMYPDATIRQYLNMRRITKDKGCLILFLIYSFGIIIMMGIGFFYGNYNTIGLFTNANVANHTTCQLSTPYVNDDFTSCISECFQQQLFIGNVCVSSNISQYNPSFSQEVNGLISMYDLKYTLPMITYMTIGLITVTGILVVLLIFCSKLLYFYILLLFLMLLGFSFYLLKLVELRSTDNNISQSSIFYQQDQRLRFLAFVLLAIYLVIFPYVLFSPQKIKLCIIILSSLRQFFSSMIKMNLFSLLVILIAWGSCILEIFLIINFYSSGQISPLQEFSMFYTFINVDISHPASLTFHFIGIYWIFVTLISWHKYYMGSGVCLWYFQESQSVYSFRRCLQRSIHHIGSAATDAILMPLEWILLMIYAICKVDSQQEEIQNDEGQSSCVASCLMSIRSFFSTAYSKINANCYASGTLTNLGYFQSCTLSKEVFSINSHRLWNIGGTIQIFMTVFCCIFWVMIFFFPIYYGIYNTTFPPPISSINLPMLSVFLMSLVFGSLFSNIFSASIDSLLFCYLIQRKSLIQNGIDEDDIRNRQQFEIKIKETLDDCYYKSKQYEKDEKNIYIYQETQANTLQLTYVSRRE